MPKTKKLSAIKQQALPKKTFKQQKKTHLIKKPAQPPLLVAIRRVPYFPLRGLDKVNTLKIAYVQLHIMNRSLLGIHQFLCGKGLAVLTDRDIDLQVLLKIIKNENQTDPLGFLPRAMSEDDVNKTICVRNNTAHLNLNKIQQIWTNDVPAYVLLNNSINQPDIATEIQGIVNRMNSGDFDGLVTFRFEFTPGFSFEKAFGLSMIVHGVVLQFLAEPILTFLRLKLNIPDITMDVYANVNYLIDQLKANADYISPGGVSRNDAQVLQTVFDCRNDNAHMAFTRSSTDWKIQLDAVVELLNLIHHHTEALEVQRIVDRLVRLEAEGAVVTQEDFKFLE